MGKILGISALIIAILAACTGCVTYGHPRTMPADKAKELNDKYDFIKNVSAFIGTTIGGIIGGVTVPNQSELVAGAAKGSAAGCAAGYGLGFLITSIMNANEGPDTSKADERFQDYRNMQLR